MGILGRVWYGGQPPAGGLKFLLRTGPQPAEVTDNFDDFLWYVGGDRPDPYPIDKSGLVAGTQWAPISIVATGPGLDDWVVCAVDDQGGGGRTAFLDATGVLRISTISVPASGSISTDSTGNFASTIRADNVSGNRTAYWASATSNVLGLSANGYAVNQGFYFLPNVARNLEPGVVSRNTKRHAVANPTLTYSLRAPGTSTHTLYRADGSRTNLPAPIDGLQMFFQGCSLVDLVLWRWSGLSPFATMQTETQSATLAADRWQLYDDATWAALESKPVAYYLNSGLVRVDMSGWIEA